MKSTEVQIFSGKEVMIAELFLPVERVSGLDKNQCPLSAGISVRFSQDYAELSFIYYYFR